LNSDKVKIFTLDSSGNCFEINKRERAKREIIKSIPRLRIIGNGAWLCIDMEPESNGGMSK